MSWFSRRFRCTSTGPPVEAVDKVSGHSEPAPLSLLRQGEPMGIFRTEKPGKLQLTPQIIEECTNTQNCENTRQKQCGKLSIEYVYSKDQSLTWFDRISVTPTGTCRPIPQHFFPNKEWRSLWPLATKRRCFPAYPAVLGPRTKKKEVRNAHRKEWTPRGKLADSSATDPMWGRVSGVKIVLRMGEEASCSHIWEPEFPPTLAKLSLIFLFWNHGCDQFEWGIQIDPPRKIPGWKSLCKGRGKFLDESWWSMDRRRFYCKRQQKGSTANNETPRLSKHLTVNYYESFHFFRGSWSRNPSADHLLLPTEKKKRKEGTSALAELGQAWLLVIPTTPRGQFFSFFTCCVCQKTRMFGGLVGCYDPLKNL